MVNDTLTVGIIGCGNITATMHLPLLLAMERVRVEYLADIRSPEKLAAGYGLRGITLSEDLSGLPKTDVTLIATPVGVREPYIAEMSKRKSAVLTEKPFAMDLGQHESYLRMNDRISCNYTRLSLNSTWQLRELVASQVFGRLLRVSVAEGGVIGTTGKAKNHYQTNRSMSGGGILMETGCHPLSQLAFIMAGYDIEVSKADLVVRNDLEVEVSAVMDGTGSNGNVEVSFLLSAVRPVKPGFTLEFENAVAHVNHISLAAAIDVRGRDNRRFNVEREEGWALNVRQAFYLIWKNFLEKVRSGKPFDTAVETSLMTTTMIEGIYATGGVR